MKVKFEQSFYTSCQKGLTTGPGFQTKAMTPSIEADTRRLVERYVAGYQLPRGRDRNIEEGQPMSLKSFSVGREKWCFSLTQYRRLDRKGALGNFFVHNLICSNDDFKSMGANPFLIYHSGQFQNDDPGTATELPTLDVEIAERTIGPVLERLREKIQDETRLSSLIDAFLVSPSLEPPRPVVIVSGPDTILLILEGILSVLPLSVRAQVSFTSYEFSKSPGRIEDPAIPGATTQPTCWGTTEVSKSGQSYSEIDANYSLLLFDFESSRFSKIPIATEFSRWISGKIFNGASNEAEGCIQFLSSYDLTIANLDTALWLYLLPDVVSSGQDDRAAAALRFAEAESRSSRVANSSLGRLLAVPEGSPHEKNITGIALTLAAKFGSPLVEDLYERFSRFLKTSISARDRRNSSLLLGAAESLPMRLQIALVEELSKAGVEDEYLAKALEGALKANYSQNGRSGLSGPEGIKLFEYLAVLVDRSFGIEDKVLRSRLDLLRYLSEEEQVDLICRITTLNGLKEQAILLKKALQNPMGNTDDGKFAEALGERAKNLFSAAADQGNAPEASYLLEHVFQYLAPAQRKIFVQTCLFRKMNALWLLLRRDPQNKGVVALADDWLTELLQDDLIAALQIGELSSRSPRRQSGRPELMGFLTRYIEGPRIIDERRDEQRVVLQVVDVASKGFTVVQSGNQLCIWKQDIQHHAAVVALLLGEEARASSPAAEFEIVWKAVLEQLSSKRLRNVSIEVFRELCSAFSLKTRHPRERLRVYWTHLVPLLDELPDKQAGALVLIASLLEGDLRWEGDSSAELRELLRKLGISMGDLRAIYARKPNPALFDVYLYGLDTGKVGLDLVELYKNANYSLFTALIRRLLPSRSNQVALVRYLLQELPALAKDEDRLTTIVGACATDSDGWGKVVAELSQLLHDSRSDSGIAALARQSILRTRSVAKQGGPYRLAASEEEVIEEWLRHVCQEPTDELMNSAMVIREIRRLPDKPSSLKSLMEKNLNEFTQRKARMAQEDYTIAAQGILSFVCRSEELKVISNGWESVENIATRNTGSTPDESLIAHVFRTIANREGYSYLLADVTVIWITDWRKYESCRGALKRGYELLETRKRKERYENFVREGLRSTGRTEAANSGLAWWQGMIDPPPSGFIDRLLGR